jgi:tRNA pseudouridine38-40 synthase
MAIRRIALTVQYDGTDFAGMQWQPHAPTIQGALQGALAGVLGHPVSITGASRTDAGVHALGQIVAFQTDRPIPVDNLVRALNDRLPRAISVTRAVDASPEFHPRFDAVSKLYSYRILNCEAHSPFIERYAWHVPDAMDVGAFTAGAQCLLGQHDFAAFCAAGSSVKGTERTLYQLQCSREGDLLECRIAGSGFLYMMVRIIVGTLVEVAAGRLEADAVGRILESRDRGQAGPTAPAHGLCLVRIEY